jgi:GTP pyrophosphokinase
MEKALSTLGQSLGQVSPVRLNQVLDEMKLPDIDGLLVEIGLGNRMATLVARQLVGQDPSEEPDQLCDGTGSALAVRGTEGLVVNYGRCCHPIPGDPVIGLLSAGRGLVVHRENCRNVAEQRERADRTVALEWSSDPGAEFAVSVRAQTANRRGALAEMASVIADHGSNIEHITFNERDGHSTAITFTITVRDRHHLAQIIRSLRRLNDVLRVQRARG